VTNWRIYLVGGLLAAAAAGSMYIAHLQTEMAKAKQEIESIKGQVTVTEGTAQAVDRLVIEERNITHEVQNVVREIDTLPTGEALVPDDVARIWADGVDRLRDDTAKPDGDDSREPEGLPR
jgi:hypothetical protein